MERYSLGLLDLQQSVLREVVESITFLKPEYEKITKELAQVYGFITVDIKQKEEAILKRLKDKIESDAIGDNALESFIKKIKDMKEELSS